MDSALWHNYFNLQQNTKSQQRKFYLRFLFPKLMSKKIELEFMLPSCLEQWIVCFKLMKLWQNTLLYTKNSIRILGTVPKRIMSFIPTAATCFYTAANSSAKLQGGIHWYLECFKGLCTNSS